MADVEGRVGGLTTATVDFQHRTVYVNAPLTLTTAQQGICDVQSRRWKATEVRDYRAERQLSAELEVAQQAVRDTFMPGYRLTTGSTCARRLLGKRCTSGWGWRNVDCGGPHLPPGADHTTLWVKANSPAILITQPYAIAASGRGDYSKVVEPMREWGERNGLNVWDDPYLSWWAPGGTTLVMFTAGEIAG